MTEEKNYSEDLRNLLRAMKDMGFWGQIGLPHDWDGASALEYIKDCESKGIDPIMAIEDTISYLNEPELTVMGRTLNTPQYSLRKSEEE